MTQKHMKDLIDAIKKFRDDRNWKQFHNAKDLALALLIEAAELSELYLWKDSSEANTERVKEELADVIIYTLLLLDTYDLDMFDIVRRKLDNNIAKYPVDLAKGRNDKYNELNLL